MWTENAVKALLTVLIGLATLGYVFLYKVNNWGPKDYDTGVAMLVGLIGLGILAIAIAWLQKKCRKDKDPKE
jgi:hypothetical protein